MNVFIVLIPMLLMSAVFVEIRVIEMSQAAASTAPASATPPLDLAVVIGSDAYMIEGQGIAPVSVPRPAAAGPDARPGAAASRALQQALAAVVAAHPGSQDVRLVAGERTRYQEIVAVMDLARAAGLPHAALQGGANEGSGS